MKSEQIYSNLMGYYFSEYTHKEIVNLFADGTVCDGLYTEVYEAKLRINERLGTQEDPDMELIINHLLQRTQIVSHKMYLYGTKAGEHFQNSAKS